MASQFIKMDFYRDTVLYIYMQGADFMHIVAVSGVLYLFLGFFTIARKPVNWGLALVNKNWTQESNNWTLRNIWRTTLMKVCASGPPPLDRT